MKPVLVKLIFCPFIKRAACSGLVGRNKDRRRPEQGRFTRAEVDALIDRVWLRYDRLGPTVPPEPRFGNRMNMALACLTLACFQDLLKVGIERAYAVELIGDVAWKIYEKWGRLPNWVARTMSGDPARRMQISVNMFLRFPFTPPGYVFERLPSGDGVSIDMQRCPVADYLLGQEASDLCLGAWCNQDFALAHMWGGWLERSETLAVGCSRCDFRFRTRK